MSGLFNSIGDVDWRRELRTARGATNQVSQLLRVGAGWPADLNYELRVTSPTEVFVLDFQGDICTSERYPGWSYDVIAADLRCQGWAFRLVGM